MDNRQLFQNYKYCDICHRPLSPNYRETSCPSCAEHALFQKVKDFIRASDVNEYQVSMHFNIPLHQVRKWIREGRIQYKETSAAKVTLHCQVCGAQVAFGSICPKCLKEQNTSGGIIQKRTTDPGNMRHLQISNNKE